MKKMFLALVAVLVMVSCGGTKSEVPVEKVDPVSEYMTKSTDMLNRYAERLQGVEDYDALIDAMLAFKSESEKLLAGNEVILDSINTMPAEEYLEKYSKEIEALQAAAIRISEIMIQKDNLLEELTPEQETKLLEIMGV